MTPEQIELMKMIIIQQATIIESNFQMLQLIAPVSFDEDEPDRMMMQ